MTEKKKQERKPAEDVRPAKDGYISKMNGAKGVCGAKRTNGEPCHGMPMKNGRCRIHGGKSTGPKDKSKIRRNTNAVKTGEHQAIWLDAMSDEEALLYDSMNIDILIQLEEEIRLLSLRERRMLHRIKDLEGTEFIPSSVEVGLGIQNGRDMDYEKETAQSSLDVIQHIEEALTRVQDKKAKLLTLKHEIESMTKKADVDPSHIVDAMGQSIPSTWATGDYEITGERDDEDDEE